MLTSRKVFIDTQCFVKSGLNLDKPVFRQFVDLCKKDELFNITTTVVKNEVKGKIESSINDALSALKKFRTKANILSSLKNNPVTPLFVSLPENEICNEGLQIFEEFLNECKTTVLNASNVNAEVLIELYFDKKAPFGEGKKKNEFPDAISLLSLKGHLRDDEQIYIISEDHDLKKYCDDNSNFLIVETIEKFLDLYNTHKNYLTAKVKQYITDNSEDIKTRIKDYLEDSDVYNNSTWEDAEAHDYEVINVGEIAPLIIFINDETCQLSFEVDVESQVGVTGPDYNNGIYDKEDGRIYTFDSSTRVVDFTNTYTIDISLSYELDDGEITNIDIEDFLIPDVQGGIEVQVEENEECEWY